MGSNDIVVAVVDSGIDFTHPDLQDRIAANGWNFLNNTADPTDDFGHGTFCAGIIAAAVNNRVGMAGVCPTAKILPLKFLDSTGHGYTDKAASAIDYAFNQGARIFNRASRGLIPKPSSTLLMRPTTTMRCWWLAPATTPTRSWSIPPLIVMSSRSAPPITRTYWRIPPTLGRGLTSSRPAATAAAPPRATRSCPSAPRIAARARRSTASTRAGAAAPFRRRLFPASWPMRTYQPRLQMERVRQILRTTADDVMEPGWDWQTGYGRVNAFAALQPTNAVITLITSPANFQFTAGTLDVVGTAYGIPFAWSVVEWGYGWAPTNWTLLVSNSTRLYNTTLASWDTTQVPDGEVHGPTALSRSGTTTVTRTGLPSLFLHNRARQLRSARNTRAGRSRPAAPTPLRRRWPTSIGMANRNCFGACATPWSSNARTEHPIPAGRSRCRAARADQLRWRTWMAMALRRSESFGMENSRDPGLPDTIFLWHADGHPVSGWPKTFDPVDFGAYHLLSPVFADIDGDGVKEVLWYSCGTNSSGAYPATMVHVDRVNGSALPGWPLVLPGAADRTSTAPAVGDVDGDGRLDIVLVTCHGWLYPLHQNGQVFEGWPIIVVGGSWGAPPALADIDHDGHLDILAVTYGGIYCYRSDGTLLPGWPRSADGISGRPLLEIWTRMAGWKLRPSSVATG